MPSPVGLVEHHMPSPVGLALKAVPDSSPDFLAFQDDLASPVGLVPVGLLLKVDRVRSREFPSTQHHAPTMVGMLKAVRVRSR
jgi:hypothetical protein